MRSLFPVEDGQIQVGGHDLESLVPRAGQTPFYVYDRAVILDRVRGLREAVRGAVQIHYAIKANPMPALVRFMTSQVDGLDVASAQELVIALETGASPEHISFAGPGKRLSELRQAVTSNILVNVESLEEVRQLEEVSKEAGRAARVAVRVNPDFELKHAGLKMGGGSKPFGVDTEHVPAVIREIDRRGLRFQGFHIFAGSQNLKAEAIVESQTRSIELVARFADLSSSPITVINLGGGLGIPYFAGDKTVDLAPIGDNLQRLRAEYGKRFPTAQWVMELGRYLVGEAGLYVCRVLAKKESRGQIFLVVDGGMHHHLAAAGLFGQVIRKNYPVWIGNKMGAPATEKASVVGPLCTPLDVLADRMDLPQAEVGDFVVVFQSGAYGRSASPLGFLSHPPPPELLV